MGCISSKHSDPEEQYQPIYYNDLASFYQHMNNLLSANHQNDNGESDEESVEDIPEEQIIEVNPNQPQQPNLNPFFQPSRRHG
jgi:hypothetical protein